MNLSCRLFFRLCVSLLVLVFGAFCFSAEEISSYASYPSLSFEPEREESFSGLADRLDLQEELQRRSPQASRKQGLIQRVNFGGSWIPEGGDSGLGLATFNTNITFALPGPKTGPFGPSYFLISPAFSYTNIQWEHSQGFPDSLYTAGLSLSWMKPINERWNLMLNATPGYAGDGKATSYAVRCPVILGLTWTPNSRWKVVFGAGYMDRSDFPVLPFAGVVYTPNEDWKFELMAPQPRVARRLSGWSDVLCNRWVYLGGGFGGGAWAVESWNGRSDLAMYREFSLTLGYEAVRTNSGFLWNVEIAYIFGRKMEFDHDTRPDYSPDDALALRVKVSF